MPENFKKESAFTDQGPWSDVTARLTEIRYDVKDIKKYIDGTIPCAFAHSLEKPLQEMAQNLLLLSRDVESQKDDLQRLKKTVYGNGDPGMDERVNQLMRLLAALNRAAWLVAGIVLSLVIGSLYVLLTKGGS